MSGRAIETERPPSVPRAAAQTSPPRALKSCLCSNFVMEEEEEEEEEERTDEDKGNFAGPHAVPAHEIPLLVTTRGVMRSD